MTHEREKYIVVHIHIICSSSNAYNVDLSEYSNKNAVVA